ncbi:MAG: type II toxin-antitoxin system VapC family toxin [Leptolinea sp.]|jgi:predicted nucleic acid-binding protein|nr:type II toxin-antitoxin system VapC family toxin [Leptolinea sp.]
MTYLLDTCVLSEFSRKSPDIGVIHWIDSVPDIDLYICVITLGEIQRGIEKLPESHRKTSLTTWMNEDLLQRFSGRLVSIDPDTMLIWGAMTAHLDAIGQPMNLMDSLIASCALRQNMVLVTRNESDFQASGIRLVNPWK